MSNYDHLPITDPPQQDPEKKQQEPNPTPARQPGLAGGYTPQGKGAEQYVQGLRLPDDSKPQNGFLERCMSTICCCCSIEDCF